MDITKVRNRFNIPQYQWSALMGVCHTTQSKVEGSKKHRYITAIAYRLIEHYELKGIQLILELWMTEELGPPKNEEQTKLLFQLADRFLREDKVRWEARMRELYPSLCPPVPARNAGARRWRADRKSALPSQVAEQRSV